MIIMNNVIVILLAPFYFWHKKEPTISDKPIIVCSINCNFSE